MGKITFMGAGSTVFAKNVLGDAMMTESLRDFEIALYDIDAERLEESYIMVTLLNKNVNENRARISKYLGVQTIGYDKINQLRHIKYFKNVDGLRAHMKKQADYLRPKFDCALAALDFAVDQAGRQKHRKAHDEVSQLAHTLRGGVQKTQKSFDQQDQRSGKRTHGKGAKQHRQGA